jgi:hypothetical protein
MDWRRFDGNEFSRLGEFTLNIPTVYWLFWEKHHQPHTNHSTSIKNKYATRFFYNRKKFGWDFKIPTKGNSFNYYTAP